MRYRDFGATGLKVSEIGLGAWQLGNRADWTDGPDEGESLAIVGAALDGGVTFFDTAPGYAGGQSERLLGRALRGRRDEVVLCTKFGYDALGRRDFSPAALRGSIENSLRELSTDVLDIVVLHNPPSEMYDGTKAEHYEILEEIKAAGLIRAYGASLDWPEEIETLQSTTGSLAMEVYLSVFHQETWTAIEQAGAAGMGSAVKVPLESGWLAGRYDAATVFSDARSRWSREEIRRRADLAARFREALPAGLPPAHAALRFVLANTGVSTVIPGAKSVAQLTANLAAADADLPAGVVEKLSALFADHIAGDPLRW
jgi:aryl-alcohol dehydrogenase-like predicted oxidoreductase